MIGIIPASAPLIEPISWFFLACIAGGLVMIAALVSGWAYRKLLVMFRS